MSAPIARVNGWLTQVAVGRQLSYRTVRARLTLLYGGLFVLSGAALMAIAYLLLVNAGFVFSLPSGHASTSGPQVVFPTSNAAPAGFPRAGMRTHPSPQTMAYWRGVALCMHRHGVSGFPNPSNVMPRLAGSIGEVSLRDGAILVFGAGVNMQSAAASAAANACGFYADSPQQLAREDSERVDTREQLLLQSGIALAVMSVLSLALGWFLAGRVLQPLEAADAAQRQFVANASHELRAPLTRQRALIQVALADPHADAAALRAAHERVLAAEQHLEQMINGLLTLTRGQAGLERVEGVDLAAVAASVLAAHDAEVRSLELSVRALLSPAPIQGDPRLIERMLANLIANAIGHNRVGGQVDVETGTRERAPYLSVSNSGLVVASEDVERLLRPFERVGAARTGSSGGHGLGLSIVRAITDAHGAELHLKPQPHGGLFVEVRFSSARALTRHRLAAPRLRRASARATLGE